MTRTLQYAFLESKGKPIQIGNYLVVQGDKIPIKRGVIRCRILTPLDGKQGISLAAPKGKISLSDGSTAKLLYVWNEVGFPSEVEHFVECPEGELKVSNVYRIFHKSGLITEDRWTGNAGIIVTEVGKNCRRYACSNGIGEFDPNNFKFEIEWK